MSQINNENNKTMARDTIIYMLAKIIEGVVGVFTISIMSYLYVPMEMGKYSTVNVAVTTLAMVCIQWLTQSVFRYIHKYKKDEDKSTFYSTIFVSWRNMNFTIISIGLLLLILFKDNLLHSFIENYSLSLLVTSFIMFITYNTWQLVISMLAGMGKSTVNLKMSIFNVCGKLILVLCLNYIFGANIIWVFVSYIILDFLTICIGVKNMDIVKHINSKKFSKEIQKDLWFYGMPLIGNMIATSILNKSDIYIITNYWGEDKAGIYQTNYSIIASAFILIASGAMRGSYPTILKAWNDGSREKSEELLKVAIRNYLLVSIPAVVGVFSISDMIAQVLFDNLYWEGHTVMGFVALGMMFLGLTEYAIKPWELNSNTKEIVKRSMFSGICNIIMNLCFISVYGYKFAGLSTAISFCLYFILALIGTRKHMKFQLDMKAFSKIIGASFVMAVSVYICKSIVNNNFTGMVICVMFAVIFYGITLYLTGEIKNEIEFIKQKISNK